MTPSFSTSRRRVLSSSRTGTGTAASRTSRIPAADGIPTWLIRGEVAAGGLMPEEVLPAFAARIGPDHILTIADGPHAPQRLRPESLTLALLRALA